MFSTPSKFLFILLAVLQVFAPLVHAHAKGDQTELGFHLPGYEQFRHVSDTQTIQNVSKHSFHNECVIISVSTGIKNSKFSVENNFSFYLPTKIFSYPEVVHIDLIDAPAVRQVIIASPYYTLLPSRAPPAFII